MYSLLTQSVSHLKYLFVNAINPFVRDMWMPPLFVSPGGTVQDRARIYLSSSRVWCFRKRKKEFEKPIPITPHDGMEFWEFWNQMKRLRKTSERTLEFVMSQNLQMRTCLNRHLRMRTRLRRSYGWPFRYGISYANLFTMSYRSVLQMIVVGTKYNKKPHTRIGRWCN